RTTTFLPSAASTASFSCGVLAAPHACWIAFIKLASFQEKTVLLEDQVTGIRGGERDASVAASGGEAIRAARKPATRPSAAPAPADHAIARPTAVRPKTGCVRMRGE